MESDREKKEIIESWHRKAMATTDLVEFKKNINNFYLSMLKYGPYKSAWRILETECDNYYKEYNKDCEKALDEYLKIQDRHKNLWKGLFKDAKPLENNPYTPEQDFHLIKREWIPESPYDKRKYFLEFRGISNFFHQLGVYKPLKVFTGYFLENDFKIEKEGVGEKITFSNKYIMDIEDKINKRHPIFLKSRSGNDFMIFRATIENIEVTDPFGLLVNEWNDEFTKDLFALFFLKMVSEGEKKNVMVLIKKAVENTFLHLKEIALENKTSSVLTTLKKEVVNLDKNKVIQVLATHIKYDEESIMIKRPGIEIEFAIDGKEAKLIECFIQRKNTSLPQKTVYRECYGTSYNIDEDEITKKLDSIRANIVRGRGGIFKFSIPETGTERMITFGFKPKSLD